MKIKQTRIRSISRHLGFLNRGEALRFGIHVSEDFSNTLIELGFDEERETGETLLPPGDFGPISEYNAEGKYQIHRDRPKETAYRMVEWEWEEWRGRYDTEKRSKIVEVPYERYPRTFVPPPGIEFTISENERGDELIITKEISFIEEKHELIIHTINLFLEIFGEVEVFSEDLESISPPAARRLNWSILPPGEYPWERLREHVQDVIENASSGKQPIVEDRFKTINSYDPEFRAVGKAGFYGYVVFGFPNKGLFVCESAFTGNATYVFGEDWKELTKLTKSQILSKNLQTDRIIHRESWYEEVDALLG